MGSLDGKIAFISGSGGAQGRAASLLFAHEGAKVVGSDVLADDAEETLHLVRVAGGEMVSISPVDLASPDGAKKWIEEGVEVFGGIDILYNNAGAGRSSPFSEMTFEDWQYTMHEVDVVVLPTRYAWPHLVKRGGGSVINTGSIAGLRALRGFVQTSHAAAKAAVDALTRNLAQERAVHGIRCNTIHPGPILTRRSTLERQSDPTTPQYQIAQRVPLGRYGRPEEIASLALFLASDESSFITGAGIVIDGGLTATA